MQPEMRAGCVMPGVFRSCCTPTVPAAGSVTAGPGTCTGTKAWVTVQVICLLYPSLRARLPEQAAKFSALRVCTTIWHHPPLCHASNPAESRGPTAQMRIGGPHNVLCAGPSFVRWCIVFFWPQPMHSRLCKVRGLRARALPQIIQRPVREGVLSGL